MLAVHHRQTNRVMAGINPEELYVSVIHLGTRDTIYHNILSFKETEMQLNLQPFWFPEPETQLWGNHAHLWATLHGKGGRSSLVLQSASEGEADLLPGDQFVGQIPQLQLQDGELTPASLPDPCRLFVPLHHLMICFVIRAHPDLDGISDKSFECAREECTHRFCSSSMSLASCPFCFRPRHRDHTAPWVQVEVITFPFQPNLSTAVSCAFLLQGRMSDTFSFQFLPVPLPTTSAVKLRPTPCRPSPRL